MFVGVDTARPRYELGGALKSYLGKTSVSIADDQWHTMAISKEANMVAASMDGITQEGGYNDTAWAGFFSRAGEITSLTIGGGNGNYWTGAIGYVTITAQVLTAEQREELSAYIAPVVSSKNSVDSLLDESPDNTWVFVGSDEIKSSTASSGGARTFVGHFEEYLRWVDADGQDTYQRYMFSTSPAPCVVGDTLADLVYTLDGVVQEDAQFTLVHTADYPHNLLFAVEGDTLVIENPVDKGQTYQIYLQAEAEGIPTAIIVDVTIPLEEGTLLHQTDLQLADVSQAYPLTAQELSDIVEADSLTITKWLLDKDGVSSMSEAQYVELPDGSIRVYARIPTVCSLTYPPMPTMPPISHGPMKMASPAVSVPPPPVARPQPCLCAM